MRAITLLILLGVQLAAGSAFAGEHDPRLLSDLLGVHDTYAWDSSGQRYVLSRPETLEQVAAKHYKDNARTLDDLVACMSNRSPSNVFLKSKPVHLGIVCYVALTMLIYFEADTESSSGKRAWKGYVSPEAGTTEILEAQKAWAQVVRKHEYTNL